MKVVVSWSPEAIEDLMDIYRMIGADSPAAAERWFGKIEEKVALLQSQPRLGVARPEIAPSARMLIEGLYLILYEIRPNTHVGRVDEIEIVAIVHGHRDLNQPF